MKDKFAVLVVCLIAALGVVACGDDDDDEGGGATPPTTTAEATTDASGGIAAARAEVEKYSGDQKFEVPALSKKPEAGKTVAHVNCTVPTCNPGEMEEPLKALGWSYKRFDYDITKGPEDFTRAARAAIRSKPDYMSMTAIFGPLVKPLVAEAQKAGIKVNVTGAVESYGADFCTQCAPTLTSVSTLMSDIALADAGKKTKMAIALDPSLEVLTVPADAIDENLKKNGEGSTIKRLELSFARPPAENAATTVSFLQRNPDVEYLLYSTLDLFVGVYPKLKSAGVADQVKVVGSFPFSERDVNLIGTELIAAAAGERAHQWRTVDAFARMANGDDLGDNPPTASMRVMTPENKSPELMNPPDFKNVYKTAWQVTG